MMQPYIPHINVLCRDQNYWKNTNAVGCFIWVLFNNWLIHKSFSFSIKIELIVKFEGQILIFIIERNEIQFILVLDWRVFSSLNRSGGNKYAIFAFGFYRFMSNSWNDYNTDYRAMDYGHGFGFNFFTSFSCNQNVCTIGNTHLKNNVFTIHICSKNGYIVVLLP